MFGDQHVLILDEILGLGQPHFKKLPHQLSTKTYGGVLSHRGTPSHHPFQIGIFHDINHPAIGVPP